MQELLSCRGVLTSLQALLHFPCSQEIQQGRVQAEQASCLSWQAFMQGCPHTRRERQLWRHAAWLRAAPVRWRTASSPPAMPRGRVTRMHAPHSALQSCPHGRAASQGAVQDVGSAAACTTAQVPLWWRHDAPFSGPCCTAHAATSDPTVVVYTT